MHFSLLNLVSALMIGVIIGFMASIHDPKLKAMVYSLPFPATIALIATHGNVTSNVIIGLYLLNGYLWAVYILKNSFKINVLIADILSAIMYIAIGYLLIHSLHVSFVTICISYSVIWLLAVVLLHRHPIAEAVSPRSAIPPYQKATSTFLISTVLFGLKDSLAGIVVSFPFSGVFAVIEAKNYLATLARIFLRNSIAILALFITIHALHSFSILAVRLLVGWLAYLIVLKLVRNISV